MVWDVPKPTTARNSETEAKVRMMVYGSGMNLLDEMLGQPWVLRDGGASVWHGGMQVRAHLFSSIAQGM
jgi:hypothetical protein